MTTSKKQNEQDIIDDTINYFSKIILGKEKQIKLTLACLLSEGHLLIEDLPGLGKTTLALVTARAFNLDFNRIQFTNDLLPADILGTSIYQPKDQHFVFRKGPIFSNFILADEINRASPKTQSALLESMEEKQVSIEGETYLLPSAFFVMATQNPDQQSGTFPLPESQIDRFLMKISLGYPDQQSEMELLEKEDRRDLLKDMEPLSDINTLQTMQKEVKEVYTSKDLLRYILALVYNTRHHKEIYHGLSPRASLYIKRAAQAWAYIEKSEMVLPEHVKAVFPAVAEHRLMQNKQNSSLIENIMDNTEIP